MKQVTRRDFLKLSSLGLAAVLVPPLNFDFSDPFDLQQGRVAVRTVWVYDEPSNRATKIKLLPRDSLFNITNTAISAEVEDHNRIWYRVNEEGYAHSGSIQPVRTTLSQPYGGEIPKEGLLAEVCVPYTDAHLEPRNEAEVGYRIYYETTHWVKAIANGTVEGQSWYQIYDDKWDEVYFVRAEHLRIMPPEELAPIAADVPQRDKKIVVRLDQQLVTAYEGSVAVFSAPVATGGRLRSGTYTTPQGNFITYYKRPSRHMASGDLASNGYDLPGVPWVQYITQSGIAFHGTFWHNEYGRPRSRGCINLNSAAAKWLYLWSAPVVPLNKQFLHGNTGTQVEITT